MSIAFPSIDPVIFSIGPLEIRWYSLAYVGGILAAWFCMNYLIKRHTYTGITSKHIEDLMVWLVIGIVLGGRIGYTLFYNFPYYSQNPAEIFKLWQGGMSFHGGIIGVTLAGILFCQKYNIDKLHMGDLFGFATPIGLFFGRLANFINGELYGRTTDVAWGVIFPQAGPLPRHPSQLYEALTEGLLVFIILWLFANYTNAKAHKGFLMGVFLMGYASSRLFCELFREPDEQLGFIFGEATMGQLLSLPMLLIGLYFAVKAANRKITPDTL